MTDHGSEREVNSGLLEALHGARDADELQAVLRAAMERGWAVTQDTRGFVRLYKQDESVVVARVPFDRQELPEDLSAEAADDFLAQLVCEPMASADEEAVEEAAIPQLLGDERLIGQSRMGGGSPVRRQ